LVKNYEKILNVVIFKHLFQLAVDYKSNFMLETPTWRASRDWGAKVGLKKIPKKI